jgi:hypothetical protein
LLGSLQAGFPPAAGAGHGGGVRRLACLLVAVLAGLSPAASPREVAAARWGSAYGDPPGFCPAQSWLPSTYTTLVTNDPGVAANPERDTFWGIHANPGYDDWYGYWYGDFAGRPGDDSGWHHITTSYYGAPAGHWNFSDYGWQVHGHAKQYIAYYNWTFGGQCGLGRYGNTVPPPYMADVFGYPVADIYVDAMPPDPPQPRATAVTPGSVTFGWDPVADRGDGAGADYFASGMDHYASWLTVAGGPPEQRTDSGQPRSLTATGLAAGVAACVHVIAFDLLQNATPEQTACAQVLTPPPMPSPPPAPAIGVSPAPPGLAGLESWFWLTPAPAAVTTDLGRAGYQYRLTAAPKAVAWTFGDGATAALDTPAGGGQAYPARSTVTHAYDRHNAGGYRVTAVVSWSVSWSVLSGGTWFGPYQLGTLESPAAGLAYPVRQAQTELLADSCGC